MKRPHRSSRGRRLASRAGALLALGLTAHAQPAGLSTGLVAYWPLDGNFQDSVGIFDGTENGTEPIPFVDGKAGFGKAITLNGEDQFVEITGGEPNDLAFADGSVSIAAWFKVAAFDTSWQALVAKGEGSNWRVARNGDTSTMSYAGGLTDATGATAVTDGNWHHIVAISDAAGANWGTAIYVDGVLDGQIAGAAVLVANDSRVMIGENPGARSREWEGEIDDVAIWSRVLTEAEIASLYNSGTGRSLGDLLGWAVDTDNDGMPDEWETRYGLNPNDPSDAATDCNTNGVTNLDEYKAGLDPCDTTKPAIVSAVSTAAFDTVTLTFSEALDPATAVVPANYTISPSLAVTAATHRGNVVTLSTALQTPGGIAYTVTVKGVTDLSKFEIPEGSNTATFYSYLMVKTGISSGLKAYWNFEGNFEDQANGFDGTGNGTSEIPFVAGMTGLGQSIQLDGLDQYVEITGGSPGDLAFAGGRVSIAGWFRVGAFDKSWQALVAQGEGTSWRVARNGENPTLSYAGGLTDALGVKDVSDGNWHHFVAVSDSAGAAFGTALYIDGALDGSIAGKAVLANNGARVAIGDNPGARGRYWSGGIDDLAIWDRVLVPTEIATLYNNGTGKPLSEALATTTDVPFPAEGEFQTMTPAPNAKNLAPDTGVTIVHRDGKTAWTAANTSLRFDGVGVTPTFTKDGDVATITYKPASLLTSLSSHTVTLGYPNPDGQPATMEWSFEVVVYTGPVLDKVNGYPAILVGAAKQTDDRGGHTGAAGDRALDAGVASGVGYVPDATFLNAATADNTLTIAFFQKLRSVRASSSVWVNSPSSNDGTRGWQAHVPFNDAIPNIYFDTSGCCTADVQRINLGIDNLPEYTGDATWWQEWRHFAFVKDGATKYIYINGMLFHQGGGGPLKTDLTTLVMGGGSGIADNRMDGLLDDFVIYNGALTGAQAVSLSGGAAPSSIPGLIAHWDYNDVTVTPTISIARDGANVTITFTGALESADVVTGPWGAVAGSSPLAVPTTGPAKYYRSKQ